MTSFHGPRTLEVVEPAEKPVQKVADLAVNVEFRFKPSVGTWFLPKIQESSQNPIQKVKDSAVSTAPERTSGSMNQQKEFRFKPSVGTWAVPHFAPKIQESPLKQENVEGITETHVVKAEQTAMAKPLIEDVSTASEPEDESTTSQADEEALNDIRTRLAAGFDKDLKSGKLARDVNDIVCARLVKARGPAAGDVVVIASTAWTRKRIPDAIGKEVVIKSRGEGHQPYKVDGDFQGRSKTVPLSEADFESINVGSQMQ